MATELTEVQIEEIIKAGNEAKSKNDGKIPYGFNAELAKKYGRTSQSISQIISGKRRSKKSKKKKIVPVLKNGEKIGSAEIDWEKNKITSIIPKENLPELNEGYSLGASFITSNKYRLPDFITLRMFLQDHEEDPVCNKVYKRMFVNKKDSGVYRDFYYVIEEMGKNKK